MLLFATWSLLEELNSTGTFPFQPFVLLAANVCKRKQPCLDKCYWGVIVRPAWLTGFFPWCWQSACLIPDYLSKCQFGLIEAAEKRCFRFLRCTDQLKQKRLDSLLIWDSLETRGMVEGATGWKGSDQMSHPAVLVVVVIVIAVVAILMVADRPSPQPEPMQEHG